MPRYQLTGGSSDKFWQIDLVGRAFQVRFGRIGSDGQVKKKSFRTDAQAKREYDKLVAEKLRKGYVRVATKGGAASAPAKPAPKPAKPARTPRTIGALCTAIESYFDALAAAAMLGVELQIYKDEALAPQSAAAIASIESKLAVTLPADVKAFLARGFRVAHGSINDGDRFASMGFDFMAPKNIIKHTLMLRDAAKLGGDDFPHEPVIAKGVALSYCEPELVIAQDGVHHFSFRNPLLRVAGTFTEFLEHYLASGCFSSHDFDLLWKRVKPYVPLDIPPAKNIWVKAYKKQFPRSRG